MAFFSSLPSLPSSSSSPSTYQYDVFLSFRGADTRKGFVSHLYHALRSAGVHTFFDGDALEKGQKIDSLMKAIEESKCSVAVISQGYADSKWCLGELAAMVRGHKQIIPVFYHVEPSDVRHQTGPFESAFLWHKNNKNHCNPAEVEEWKDAMAYVGGLSGFVIDGMSGSEVKLIEAIVERVGGRSKNLLYVGDHRVGMDSHVKDVIELLAIKEGGVKMVGIYGMGGAGKTTLAKAIHNKLLPEFHKAVYMEGVKDRAKKDGLHKLQQEFISMGFKVKNLQIRNYSEGIDGIKDRFSHTKKLFAVLDDVDNIDQLKALAGGRDWFGEGTRILITTRNKEVLDQHRVPEKYNVDVLDEKQALELFSWHAFGRKEPSKEREKISKRIVEAAGRLPLALEVIGSMLWEKTDGRIWEEVERKLRRAPHKYLSISECLKVSYDGLADDEKSMFLDFACFFDHVEKEHVIDILTGCFHTPITTIDALVNRSLLKQSQYGELYMHDLLRDLGRNLASHSRLWDQEEVRDVLGGHTGTRAEIEGIVFQKNPKDEAESLDVEVFANMPKLRLLLLQKIDLTGDFSKMPTSLRSFQWKHCSKQMLPDNFYLPRIIFLDLSASNIVQVCSDSYISEKKVFRDLMVLDLSGCKELVKFPDLSCSKDLEKLCLQGCTKLMSIPDFSHGNMEELDESIVHLPNLKELNLSDCKNLKCLPSSLGCLTTLCTLRLNGCQSLTALPDSVGRLTNLGFLSLEDSGIEEFPNTMKSLHCLRELDIRRCVKLKGSLPFYDMEGLAFLWVAAGDDREGADTHEVPDDHMVEMSGYSEQLQQSRRLRFVGYRDDDLYLIDKWELLITTQCSKERVIEVHQYDAPLAKNKWQWLRHIFPYDFNMSYKVADWIYVNEQLSQLPLKPDKNLIVTPVLNLRDIDSQSLPENIGSLQSLRELQLLRCQMLTCLPESIGNLTRLRMLELEGCTSLSALPESIGSLRGLQSLHINNCESLLALPDSIGSLIKLNQLILVACKSLSTLPNSIGNMKSLRYLSLACNGIKELPDSVQLLESLERLDIRGCSTLQGRLPLWGMKYLKELLVGQKDEEKGKGHENGEEEVCEIPTSITHYSQLTKEYRKIQDLGDCGEYYNLVIWEKGSKERNIKLQVSCGGNRESWMRHIFPNDFIPQYDIRTRTEASASHYSSTPNKTKLLHQNEQLRDIVNVLEGKIMEQQSLLQQAINGLVEMGKEMKSLKSRLQQVLDDA